MKNKITKLFLVLMFSGFAANAQTERQIEVIKEGSNLMELNKLSEIFLKESTRRYDTAVKIARENNLPLSWVDENTGQFYSVDSYIPKTNKLLYKVTLNNSPIGGSVKTIGVDYLHSIGIKGQDMIIGEWDGGIALSTHSAFGGRVQVRDTQTNDPTGTYHATHVGGTMIASETAGGVGREGEAMGMAPLGKLASWNWTNDLSEMTTAASQGLLMSNHSYGLDAEVLQSNIGVRVFGRYTGDTSKAAYNMDTSRDIDLILNNAPYYTVVWAAGNDRNNQPALNGSFGGRDLLVNESVAKNNIVVAAINGIQSYTSAGSVVMSAFSNWGPTDDFRIKPDISAKGVGVYSTSNSSNNGYATEQGTSMAAPSVTSAVALWQQLYSEKNAKKFIRSSTVRALMAHTALEAGGQIGPDYMYGWGVFNAKGGAIVIENASAGGNKAIIDERSLVSGQPYEFNFNKVSVGDLTATIAWNDPAGTETTSNVANFFAPALVNDLDIRVVNTDTNTEYFPYYLKQDWLKMQPASSNDQGDNNVDNIEKIFIPGAPSGNYKVIVSNKGSLSGSQIFSLILTGHDGPLSVEEEILNSLKVYPNPFVNYFVIDGGNDKLLGSNLSIYDNSGRLMVSKKVKELEDLKINTEYFSNGLYILNIEKNGASKAFKLVK